MPLLDRVLNNRMVITLKISNYLCILLERVFRLIVILFFLKPPQDFKSSANENFVAFKVQRKVKFPTYMINTFLSLNLIDLEQEEVAVPSPSISIIPRGEKQDEPTHNSSRMPLAKIKNKKKKVLICSYQPSIHQHWVFLQDSMLLFSIAHHLFRL